MKKLLCLLLLALSSLQADNFYVGALGGVNWVQNHGHHRRYQVGYLAGLDVGYKWCYNIRTEVEITYRSNRQHHDTFVLKNDPNQVWAGLVNVLYDCEGWACESLKPFFGIGLGGASEKKQRHNSATHSYHKASFAWQLLAGVTYPLWECADASLSYRYFNTIHYSLHNHSLALGINFDL